MAAPADARVFAVAAALVVPAGLALALGRVDTGFAVADPDAAGEGFVGEGDAPAAVVRERVTLGFGVVGAVFSDASSLVVGRSAIVLAYRDKPSSAMSDLDLARAHLA